MAAAFSELEDERLEFLRHFLKWLQKWNTSTSREGKLTADTYEAVTRCTRVMIDYIEYCLQELRVEYVLPGKVQTDNLEKQFGCYRQLSGCNYHISVTQIFEAEKKIRMKSCLGLKSAKYGKINFSFENVEEWKDEIDGLEEQSLDLDAFTGIIRSDYLQNDIEENSLFYISGYAVFKAQAKLGCPICLKKIISTEETESELFKELNRGGLTVPTEE